MIRITLIQCLAPYVAKSCGTMEIADSCRIAEGPELKELRQWFDLLEGRDGLIPRRRVGGQPVYEHHRNLSRLIAADHNQLELFTVETRISEIA